MTKWEPIRKGYIPYTVYRKKTNVVGWVVGIALGLLLLGMAKGNDNNASPNRSTVANSVIRYVEDVR